MIQSHSNSNTPAVQIGRWQVAVKYFDDDYVDVLYKNDEDYFVHGSNRQPSWLALYLSDNASKLRGNFVFGSTQGTILEGNIATMKFEFVAQTSIETISSGSATISGIRFERDNKSGKLSTNDQLNLTLWFKDNSVNGLQNLTYVYDMKKVATQDG